MPSQLMSPRMHGVAVEVGLCEAEARITGSYERLVDAGYTDRLITG